MKILLIIVLLALLLGGGLFYRCFVTDRVADKGGMENPYISEMADDDTASALQEPEEPNTQHKEF